MGDDEHATKAEEKHGLHIVALHDRDQGAMDDRQYFLNEGPYAIDVDAGEEKTAPQEHQEHVAEANQMPAGGDGWVVLEGVNGCPGEEVTVIFAREMDNLYRERYFGIKEKLAAVILHEQHPN